MAFQKHQIGVLEGNIQNSSWTKDMGNSGKKYSMETTAQQLVETVDSKVKLKTKETFNLLFPPIIPIDDLRNVHPRVKSFFSERKVPNLPLAGRVEHFLEACKILTKDSEILEIVKGFKIPCLTGESSPDATHGSGASRSNTRGYREHVEEGNHTANSIRLGSF